MKKYLVLLIMILSLGKIAQCQAEDFETREWTGNNPAKPLLFYISGDGGFNNFSSNLCSDLARQGYDVIALNAKKYFWDKKTVDQASGDISRFLIKKMAEKSKHAVTFVGYSFGADVLPFIIANLSKQVKVSNMILLAPSGNTDFEIHWTDLFGINRKRSMDVVAEINKLTNTHVIIISGDDESGVDEQKITIKSISIEKLHGGHHFDGDTRQLSSVITRYAN